MKIRPILILGLLAIALWITRVPAAPQQKPEDLAQKSADSWLALTDAGNYAESWNEAAQFFKNAVTQPEWTNQIKAARGPLGKVQSRKLKSATFTKTLPGAPDGQFVVIQHAMRRLETCVQRLNLCQLTRSRGSATVCVRIALWGRRGD
jgi:hypothetical protein